MAMEVAPHSGKSTHRGKISLLVFFTLLFSRSFDRTCFSLRSNGFEFDYRRRAESSALIDS